MADLETGSSSISQLSRSFRDPHGVVFPFEGRILRLVSSAGAADLEAFLNSPVAREYEKTGRVVPTTILDESDKKELLRHPEIAALYRRINGELILEHERVPFPSFPYEWAPEMLHAAGALTLDLEIDLLPQGLGLKDATPYNVLFRGPNPVFIDVLSAERRDPGDPGWMPYAQFVRTFLLPLLANRRFGVSLEQSLFSRRDGLEPEDVYRWLGLGQRFSPAFFSLVSMPTWLGKRHNQDDTSLYKKKILQDPEKARFILRSLLNGLKRSLHSVAPPATTAPSTWTGYMDCNNYSAEHFAAKERFVQDMLTECAPKAVLDVGSNTGHFSIMAARSGGRVVSIDYDPAVVGLLWRKARQEKLDILPLTVNLTRPTPGTGWKNREWPSFLDRARGAFDMVFMLAVIHHMLVTERVPLDDIIDQAAELTTGSLLIELVLPDDSMFRRLARGREELHRDLTVEVFEASCHRYFETVRSQQVEGASRRLYWMKRRKG